VSHQPRQRISTEPDRLQSASQSRPDHHDHYVCSPNTTTLDRPAALEGQPLATTADRSIPDALVDHDRATLVRRLTRSAREARSAAVCFGLSRGVQLDVKGIR
jgi:hypothetical protein